MREGGAPIQVGQNRLSTPRFWNRIARKFNLILVHGQQPTISQVLTICLDVTDFTRIPLSQAGTKDLSAAAGTYVSYFQVPSGKRWLLETAWRGGSTTATRTMIQRQAVQTAVNATIGATSATDQIFSLPTRPLLETGDSIGMLTTGNVADTAIQMDINYLEEDSNLVAS